MITDENLLENKAPTSIIAPISYMAAGLIAYRAFYELVDLRNEIPDAIQIDLTIFGVCFSRDFREYF